MSLRRLRRWLRKRTSELQIRPRRAEVLHEIASDLNLSGQLTFKVAGAGGHDGIYYLSHNKQPLGVLRLVNPHKKRPHPEGGMPFILEDSDKRIEREWTAYHTAAPAKLTPQPLWRRDDALLCAWLPYQPLDKTLLAQPQQAWDILQKATVAVSDLHQTGLTHMDVSLANIIADDQLNHLVFVDFEYSPAPELSLPQQQVYDHLRLLESSWKFIPEKLQTNWQPWLQTFEQQLTPDMRTVSVEQLAPALGRILKAPGLGEELRRLLPSSAQ